MGRVYLACDPLLKRWVAIKVVRDGDGMAGETMARFQREAEISARLNHPNLIRVYDVGEDPEWGPYLAMEFVEGDSLEQVIAGPPLSNEAVMDLLVQAMEAVEATHELGIVHRDLKPANLRRSKSGKLFLLDFGIARDQDTGRTLTAHFVGSPAYSAPELLQSQPATDASDRWSFAVTALELLSHHHPFNGETLGATLFKVSQGKPDLRGITNPQLQALFLRALHPDPHQRPPTLRHFLSELLAHLEMGPEAREALARRIGLPLSAGPEPAPRSEHPGRPARRTLTMVLAAACLMLVLGAMARYGPWRLPVASAWGRHGLKVTSEPAGAYVQVNGVPAGRSPLEVPLKANQPATVALSLDGYWPVERRLGPGETTLHLKLAPTPFFVDLVTVPPGAEVTLDGGLRGVTPLRIQVEGPGHRVQLRLAGWKPIDQELDRTKPLPNPLRLVRETAPHGEPEVLQGVPGRQ